MARTTAVQQELAVAEKLQVSESTLQRIEREETERMMSQRVDAAAATAAQRERQQAEMLAEAQTVAAWISDCLTRAEAIPDIEGAAARHLTPGFLFKMREAAKYATARLESMGGSESEAAETEQI